MHDEASPNYIEMTDQTTRGHQFLKKNFGDDAIPRGTWSIDPFGHSNSQAWLLGAESGMESMFWGRTDYQDFNVRYNQSRLEWIWQGSQSLGASAGILAGELYGSGGGGYGTWINFDGTGNQVQDDPSRHDYNADAFVDQFVQDALSQSAHTQGEDQLWACGSDFQYQNADHWYRNLDKLIHYVNLNGTVNAFYSTPSHYADRKKLWTQTPWEQRYDDIFPLGDARHHYWSGYFTSRPALKRQIRVATNSLTAARQMEVISGVTAAQVDTPTTRPSPAVGSSWTDSLEGTIGIATHHDGMSGTERQDVADDYALRISESHTEVETGVSLALSKLMAGDISHAADFHHCNCNGVGASDCLNASACAFSSGSDEFTIVAWNPLANKGGGESQVLRIPVVGSNWSVFKGETRTAKGEAVKSQVIPIDQRTLDLSLLYINYFNVSKSDIPAVQAAYSNKATHVVTFTAEGLPPLGYAMFSLQKGQMDRRTKDKKFTPAVQLAGTAVLTKPRVVAPTSGPFTVDNGVYEVKFDPSTGHMTELRNMKSGVTTSLSIDWGCVTFVTSFASLCHL